MGNCSQNQVPNSIRELVESIAKVIIVDSVEINIIELGMAIVIAIVSIAGKTTIEDSTADMVVDKPFANWDTIVKTMN